MFRRRDDGTEELVNDDAAVAQAPASANAASAASGAAAAATAPVAQPAFRPVPPQAAVASAARGPMASPSSSSLSTSADASRSASVPLGRASAINNKRVLTVGPDIQMKGEITSCDRVVIEGTVDATMRDVHTVELTESGSLKGTAEVEDAEISGNFEGDLVVRGKLTVYSSGRVRGNVTYGEIEIQRGGQISGNIRNSADAKSGASVAPAKRAA